MYDRGPDLAWTLFGALSDAVDWIGNNKMKMGYVGIIVLGLIWFS